MFFYDVVVLSKFFILLGNFLMILWNVEILLRQQ